MATQGQLTKKQFGYSMPVTSPLYYPFPVMYRDAKVLTILYETDPQAVAKVLPSELVVPEKAMAMAIFADYPWSTLGAYQEVGQAVFCNYPNAPTPMHGQNTPMLYPVQFHVTTGSAMAAGREIAGIPKKIGSIEFSHDEQYLSYLDRPAGQRICSANFIPEAPLVHTGPQITEYVSLRVMPNLNSHNPEEPALAQLIGSVWEFGPGETWKGNGSLHFSGTSMHDPYHSIPMVGEGLECTLFKGAISAKAISFVHDI